MRMDLDKCFLERTKELFGSSYTLVGRIEYYDGEVTNIKEPIFESSDGVAVHWAELHIEGLAERGHLFCAKEFYYGIFSPDGRLIHRY